MVNPRPATTHLLGWLCLGQGTAALAEGLFYLAGLPFAALPHFLGQWEVGFALAARLTTTLAAAIFIISGLALLKGKRPPLHRWLPAAAGLMFGLTGGRILLFGLDGPPQLLGYLLAPLLILYLLASGITAPPLFPRPFFKSTSGIWLLLVSLLAIILAFRSIAVLRQPHPQLVVRNLPVAITPAGFTRPPFPAPFTVALPTSFTPVTPTTTAANRAGHLFRDDRGAQVTLSSRALVGMLPMAYLRILGFRNHDDYLRHSYTDRFGLLSRVTFRVLEEITIGPLHGFLTIAPPPSGEAGEVWRFAVFSGDRSVGEIEMRGFPNEDGPRRIIDSLLPGQG